MTLLKKASAKLPSRGMTSVEGTFNGVAFQAALEPDGQGGHWLRVDRKLRVKPRGAEAGDVVSLGTCVGRRGTRTQGAPADLRNALAAAHPKARAVCRSDITPVAQGIGSSGIESAKREETHLKRIKSRLRGMLAKGKCRRPCCFDRSGMYAKGQP